MPTRTPRLTWGGRVILTLGHAATRYRQTKDAVRMAITRAERAGQLARIDPPPIDERTPTWYQSDLDPILAPKVKH
jgi:hypothetical protein